MSDKVLERLPPTPLRESVIDQITGSDRVGEWESTLAYYQPAIGEELVFNFIIEISDSWHALVLDEDGKSGWKSLGAYVTFSESGRAISEWREANDLRFV